MRGSANQITQVAFLESHDFAFALVQPYVTRGQGDRHGKGVVGDASSRGVAWTRHFSSHLNNICLSYIEETDVSGRPFVAS